MNFKLNSIASNLFKIKHWQIIQCDYLDAPDISATWFIDPPYQFGGEVYRMSNKHLNFTSLAGWCYRRQGQIIVCENHKADWMPFQPLAKMRGSVYATTECIWTNQKINLSQQLPLL